MGLTVNWSWNRPNVVDPDGPNQAMQTNLGKLASGIGAAVKYGRKMKAADMMEAKGKAQDRIKAIDAEIAELEGKLQEYEQKRQEDTQRAQNSIAAAQAMEGYVPNSARAPSGAPEQGSPQFTTDQYQDQYIATQQALAGQPNRSYTPDRTARDQYLATQAALAGQPNRSYSPYDKNARMNAEYGMLGYRPNFRWGR